MFLQMLLKLFPAQMAGCLPIDWHNGLVRGEAPGKSKQVHFHRHFERQWHTHRDDITLNDSTITFYKYYSLTVEVVAKK